MLIYKSLLSLENSSVLCSVCRAKFLWILVLLCAWCAWLHWIMGAVHSDIWKTCLISSYVMIMGNITRYYSLLSHQITQLFTGTCALIYCCAIERIFVYYLNEKYMFLCILQLCSDPYGGAKGTIIYYNGIPIHVVGSFLVLYIMFYLMCSACYHMASMEALIGHVITLWVH